MGLADGKYSIKIIFDIKIEIGISEISDVPNMNKFSARLILGPILAQTGGKYLIKINFYVKIEVSIFETLNVPDFNSF